MRPRTPSDLRRNRLEPVFHDHLRGGTTTGSRFRRSEAVLGTPNKPVPTGSGRFWELVGTGSIRFPSPMGEPVDREPREHDHLFKIAGTGPALQLAERKVA